MIEASMAKEITVRRVNDITVLAEVAGLLAEKGIGITGVSTWTQGCETVIHLVTDDNLRAMDTLRAKGFAPRESGVILVELPHHPGMLRRVLGALEEVGVDVHHLYAAATANQESCLIALATADNVSALLALQHTPQGRAVGATV